jgi:hypothetical protein
MMDVQAVDEVNGKPSVSEKAGKREQPERL